MTDNNESKDYTKAQGLFGTRELTDENKVFQHNAWDNYKLQENDILEAEKLIEKQKLNPVDPDLITQYTENAYLHWDRFYLNNKDNFFKERNWLNNEFPELFQPEGQLKVLEIGCGTGATAYPILANNNNPTLKVYATDLSSTAINLVKNNLNYDQEFQNGRIEAYVWDCTQPIPSSLPEGSFDIITLIFCLSAINPDLWETTIASFYLLLKPGGKILFRDYGKYDMAQLRFKNNRYLKENFYIRGDQTQVYFFTIDELKTIFSQFEVEQCLSDNRLLVNRKREVKMNRVWIQAKFIKPFSKV